MKDTDKRIKLLMNKLRVSYPHVKYTKATREIEFGNDFCQNRISIDDDIIDILKEMKDILLEQTNK